MKSKTKAKNEKWRYDGKCGCSVYEACPRCIGIYEQGKKDAEEAYRTRYSILNLCHKTIATDRVSQDNLIRKQTYEEVLRIWNKLEKEDNKMVAEMGHQVGEFRIWLIKELKEAGK